MANDGDEMDEEEAVAEALRQIHRYLQHRGEHVRGAHFEPPTAADVLEEFLPGEWQDPRFGDLCRLVLWESGHWDARGPDARAEPRDPRGPEGRAHEAKRQERAPSGVNEANKWGEITTSEGEGMR